MDSSSSQETPAQSRRTFDQWVAEGEALHAELTAELRGMETQVAELQVRIREKRAQVEHVARMLGKPAAEPTRSAAGPLSQTPAGVPVEEALRIRLPQSKPPIARPMRNPGSDAAVVVPLRE